MKYITVIAIFIYEHRSQNNCCPLGQIHIMTGNTSDAFLLDDQLVLFPIHCLVTLLASVAR